MIDTILVLFQTVCWRLLAFLLGRWLTRRSLFHFCRLFRLGWCNGCSRCFVSCLLCLSLSNRSHFWLGRFSNGLLLLLGSRCSLLFGLWFLLLQIVDVANNLQLRLLGCLFFFKALLLQALFFLTGSLLTLLLLLLFLHLLVLDLLLCLGVLLHVLAELLLEQRILLVRDFGVWRRVL